MKRAFLASAASLLLVAPAFAAGGPPASTNVVVSGTVGVQCGVGNQSGGGTRSLGPAITVPVVTTDGQLNTTTTTPIGFDNVWCNAPNTLSMDVTSLKLLTPPGSWDHSSFVAAVDMVISADSTHEILPTYFGVSTLRSADATDGTVTVPAAPAFETGTLKFSEALLTLAMPTDAHSSGVRPLAGTYSGTVTVTATPN